MANDTAVGQYTGPMLGFDERWAPILQLLQQQRTNVPPDDSDISTYNNKNLPMWKRVGLQAPPISGPQPSSQQPSIPINTAQGSPPQRLQATPNSGPLVGGFSNNALTNGSGYPIGGLPTQSPQTMLATFNQMPIAGPANPQVRMQNHLQNLQRFQQFLASFRGHYSGQA